MTSALDDLIEQATSRTAASEHVVVLTCSGISKESGMPTFRGKGGLWTLNGEPFCAVGRDRA